MRMYARGKMLFTYTESLLYLVQAADIYVQFSKREHFDLASFGKASPVFDAVNNKVIGKLMDRASGKPSTEFR